MKTNRSLRNLAKIRHQKDSNSPTYVVHYLVSRAVIPKKDNGQKPINMNLSPKTLEKS